MKVKELKAALKELGLPVKGKKAQLEARLAEAQLPEEEEILEEEEEILEEEEEEVVDDNDSEEEETPEEVVEEEEPMEESVEEPQVEIKPVHNPLTNILRFNPNTGEREPMQVKKLDIQEHINGDYGMGDIILSEAEEK